MLFRSFRAIARLQIDPENQGVLNLNSLALGNQDQNYLTTQYRNLESRSLMLEVMSRLKLDTDDERYAKAIDKVTTVTKDIKIVPIRLSRLVEVQVTHPKGEQAQRIADTLLSLTGLTRLYERSDSGVRQLEGFQQRRRLPRLDPVVERLSGVLLVGLGRALVRRHRLFLLV